MTLSVTKNTVVSFNYTLTDEQGETLDASGERGPMSYLHGAGNIISGLEQALQGRQAGEAFTVTLTPAEAYGERNEANIQRIPLKRLGGGARPRPGQVLALQTQRGPVQVTVVKVGRFSVDVDANHPLAGKTLTFAVEITAVREATAEELSHGHAHGPGGHSHG